MNKLDLLPLLVAAGVVLVVLLNIATGTSILRWF
jgi:hypothetical protein